MGQIMSDQIKNMMTELTELLFQAYGEKLKAVILYGSVARGTQTDDSDVDIMVLVEGTNEELRYYDDRLCEISSDISLKYMKVLSVIDVCYQEYEDWKHISPFYRNVAEEGVVLYAA